MKSSKDMLSKFSALKPINSESMELYASAMDSAIRTATTLPGSEVLVTCKSVGARLLCVDCIADTLTEMLLLDKEISTESQLELTNGSCIRFLVEDSK